MAAYSGGGRLDPTALAAAATVDALQDASVGAAASPWARYRSRVLQLLWPGVCLLCLRRSERDIDLCLACQAALETNDGACWRCAERAPANAADGLCGACIASPPPWTRAVAPFAYRGPLQTVIAGLKGRNGQRQARTLGALAAAGIATSYATPLPVPAAAGAETPPTGEAKAPLAAHEGERFAPTTSPPSALPAVIVPMPLSRQRRRQRGFNQAELLAAVVGRALGLERDRKCLVRTRHAAPQRSLARAARLRNLRGAFAVRGSLPATRLALLDDVATTGATARAATEALLAAGAAEVHLWVVAKTPRPA